MSFRDNLQYLRASRNLTQERLAMLLGVSRQAISKWESEKAYPEMDKLLMICDLFGCTLDDLVMGDVRNPANPIVSSRDASELTETVDDRQVGNGGLSTETAQDMTGYDDHVRQFALMVASGIAAIIIGTGLASLFDDNHSIIGPSSWNEVLAVLFVFVGTVIGLALLIPGGMRHADFNRQHPFIEDFYTDADRTSAARRTAVGVVVGIAVIIIGILILIYADEVLGVDDGWPVCLMLMTVAVGVWLFVYVGVRHELMNIEDRNASLEKERKERAGERDRYGELTGAVCGIIMIIATIIALLLLFTGEPIGEMDWSDGWRTGQGLFWLSWPIGALCCGIAALIIQIFKSHHDR
ncbi:helix-turn-helix transcriptional regulator [Bifidobacterium eulemuris]|uniref:Transcriptional regulator n=1 Tax=Bifidobacterium eulemuris TaxID=1765219 RepID=A0A261GDW2_9BIFI|nr:helix-turn-helix transcriptional regulator [Bifidobacterium eulemuris]OZG69315.1 transcriptional regulator [Bifidobacterium eulemuris]QOL31186.1 helix-turn-helix transcriptional regulator [Bifidobacterium eulemuris]